MAITPPVQLSFDNHGLAMEAAAQGMGVVAGIQALTREYCSEGRLIQLFTHVRKARRGAYLVYPEDRQRTPALSSFLEFLAAQHMRQDAEKLAQPVQ
jgi:DNA-binding transcriptional LysR family regulator